MTKAAEITRQKAVASPDILSLTDLCDVAGVKASSVMSQVQRTGTTVRGAMAHLMRPAYRVGHTPWWSQEQVDRYFAAKEKQFKQQAELEARLPRVSDDEAEDRQLRSNRWLAKWAGFSHGTFNRRSNEEGFPAPKAVLRSQGPRLVLLREQGEAEAWLRARHPGWEPPAGQDAPRQ